MTFKQNPAFTRAKLLLGCWGFLLQGAWAAFSGSGFLAEGSSEKFVLADSSVKNSSVSPADPLNGDDPTLVYHHHDLLGSVVALSNKDAEAVEYFFPISTERGSKTPRKVKALQPKKAATRYTSFGKATIYNADLTPTATNTSNYSNRHLYTGREHLREFLEGKDFRAKKLSFVAARVSKDLRLPALNDHSFYYYSPHLARWTTTDPIQFQAGDINLYRYVGNGVTGSVDLMGFSRSSGNQRQDEFSNFSAEEILDEIQNQDTSTTEGRARKQRLIKEGKARGLRNVQKVRGRGGRRGRGRGGAILIPLIILEEVFRNEAEAYWEGYLEQIEEFDYEPEPFDEDNQPIPLDAALAGCTRPDEEGCWSCFCPEGLTPFGIGGNSDIVGAGGGVFRVRSEDSPHIYCIEAGRATGAAALAFAIQSNSQLELCCDDELSGDVGSAE